MHSPLASLTRSIDRCRHRSDGSVWPQSGITVRGEAGAVEICAETLVQGWYTVSVSPMRTYLRMRGLKEISERDIAGICVRRIDRRCVGIGWQRVRKDRLVEREKLYPAR